MNIGIAEDHDILRESMSKLLINEKNIDAVIQASNGKELLKLMKKTRLDVIILDLNMPIMDGRDTMKVLKSLDEDLQPKIIILTMHEVCILVPSTR